MRMILTATILGVLVVGGIGCKHNKATTQETMKMDSMKDDCPFCPGVQHADANGYCPKCGMKVK